MEKTKDFAIFIRFLKENELFYRLKPYFHKISNAYIYKAFDSAFTWCTQKEGYEFWFERQLEWIKLLVTVYPNNSLFKNYFGRLLTTYGVGAMNEKIIDEYKLFFHKMFGN